ncbi:uncharacterized protein LOC110708916 [Chenopodium quinoa]|uniref:uncharacterized protein LOC110708916 n=1 Tax=Chenopodium quinoa TaxID=63459 RepID=UPI000B775F1A|nr:uncharacterized protein LOC110708916 [Chenopodium quinoa]
MAEMLDDFFNINQLLMEQDMVMEENSSSSGSETQEPTKQQQNEDNSSAESVTDTEQENQQQIFVRQSRELNIQEKRQIVNDILLNMVGDTLPRGMLTSLAKKHHVHRSTTCRWLKEIKTHMQLGEAVDVRTKKLGKTGRKPFEYSDEWLVLKKRGRLRAVSATNHPALSDNHKVARLKWVLQHIHPIPSEGDPTIMDMQHHIHIDEKWFYLNPETRTFYLTPNEEVPYIAHQSKRFKIKAMFMGMVGKPLYAANGTLIHSGKYGLSPFVKHERAKKKSKNREAGTMETKAIQNVNREAIRHMILVKNIPTIHAQWPSQLSKNIIIQWDNTRPHQVPSDEKFLAATQANGFNIQFVFQPAQSPDLNVLDLGLFKAIQSIQYQSFSTNIDELIEKVAEAFEVFDPTLNRYTWITLQACMIKVLEKQGGNNFNPPHMGKSRQDRQGTLEEILKVDITLIADTVQYLNTLFVPTTGPQPESQEMEVDAD